MELTNPFQDDVDSQEFEKNKSRLFKGTIAVTVIYGALALLLVVLMLMTANTRQALGVDFLAFSTTFIGGMLLIIGILVFQLVTVKKEALKKPSDLYQCPDYWDLKEVEPSTIKGVSEDLRPYMHYMCTPRDKVYDVSSITTPTIAAGSKLGAAFTELNTQIPTNVEDRLSCNKMYPGYLLYQDTKENPKQPNKMRCEYSTLCNAPWSGVCSNP